MVGVLTNRLLNLNDNLTWNSTPYLVHFVVIYKQIEDEKFIVIFTTFTDYFIFTK